MGSRCGYNKSSDSKWLTSSDADMPLELKRFVERWLTEAKSYPDFTSEWYVKGAGFVFRYEDVWYRLWASAIDASNELFEHLAWNMQDELVAMGAEDVFYTGMMD